MRLIETELEDWSKISQLSSHFLRSFVFRGQENSAWSLSTSIERQKKIGYGIYNYSTDEKWMVDEFSRKYQLYCDHKIKDKNWFEYLALMQHFGAPTRLLDFSYSIYIASYFATINSNSNCSIWAINNFALKRAFEKSADIKYGTLLKDQVNDDMIGYVNSFIGKFGDNISQRAVLPVIPKHFSERLSKQQGLFLIPSDSNCSFMKNLKDCLLIEDSEFEQINFGELVKNLTPESNKNPTGMSELTNFKSSQKFVNEIGVVKFNMNANQIVPIISMLSQMNITGEVLFPGLEGLAKSLVQKQMR